MQKSFRFSVHGASLCSVACARPLVGLVLSLSLGPHIPPVFLGAFLCAWLVLCPLVGSVLSLSLEPRFRICIVKQLFCDKNFSMAANAAASFADILAAESDYNLPADDKDVRVALDSFGAVFNKRKGDANAVVRADPIPSPIFSRPFQTTSCPPPTWMFKQRLLPLVRSPRELQRCSCCVLLAGLAYHDLTELVAALTLAQQRNRGRARPSTGPAPCLRRSSSGPGQCAPNTTTSPTRLSPPPPCAGRQSGRPGAAASQPGAILYLHRLSAVLLRAVLRARAVRPDRRRHATSRRPGAVPTRTRVLSSEYDHIAAATVTSAAARRPPERPARRRRPTP